MRITYAMIREKMDGKPYTAELVGLDAKAVIAAVNQGIDSHLEACNIVGKDRFERGERKTSGGVVHTVFLDCCISVESLPVLLRRLYEMGGEYSVDGRGKELADMAETLCINILDSLGLQVDGGCFEIIRPVDENVEVEA